MIKINFIIPAYNEEDRIKDVIFSIKNFSDQIILLDPGSSDKTIEYAANPRYASVLPPPVGNHNKSAKASAGLVRSGCSGFARAGIDSNKKAN